MVNVRSGKRSGQPGLLTPARAAIIVSALKKHNYISTACELVGISRSTYNDWIHKGNDYKSRLLNNEDINKEDYKYIHFAEDCERARAGSEKNLLGRIDSAGSDRQLIERRTIVHTLKDGTEKSETIERWKPADWQANAWILERTRWEKFGQHSSLDIQSAGVIFIEQLQRARDSKIIEGQFREIESIQDQAIPEEIPPPAIIAMASQADIHEQEAAKRPIMALVSKSKQAKQGNYVNQLKLTSHMRTYTKCHDQNEAKIPFNPAIDPIVEEVDPGDQIIEIPIDTDTDNSK